MRTRMFLPGFVAGVAGFLFGWVIMGDIASNFASGPAPEHAGFPAAMRNLIGLLMAVLIFGSSLHSLVPAGASFPS